jgi:hypothetical protein
MIVKVAQKSTVIILKIGQNGMFLRGFTIRHGGSACPL